MKIGVVSDTHLKASGEWLDRIVSDYFHDVAAIFHAGDIVDGAVLEAFAGRDVVAVCGNMDSASLRRSLPSKIIVEIEGHRIGLIHGWGAPEGIEKRIADEFDNVDCVVFGHTHAAQIGYRGDIMFFNPGSPTDGRCTRKTTIGLLDIGDVIRGTIITLEPSSET